MKDLSIVVPAYNCERYIERCLISLLKQDNINYEIIVINDGSTDNTLKICKNYELKYDNIQVVSKSNEGQGIARNLGIKIAKGKYITFVDSDDFVNENCYTTAISQLKEKKSDFFIGQLKKIFNSELKNFNLQVKKNYFYNYNNYKKILINSLLTGKEIKENCRVSSSTCDKIYLKEILDKFNISFLSERIYLSEDIIFNMMYIEKCNSYIISNLPIYNYVTNPVSFCHTYQKNYLEKMYKMIDIFEKYDFSFSKKEFKSLIAEKIYGYIKSYMFQEAEHQKIYLAGKNISLLCQQPKIKNIFSLIRRENYTLVDYIIIFFSKLNLGIAVALLYKIKLLYINIKNKD